MSLSYEQSRDNLLRALDAMPKPIPFTEPNLRLAAVFAPLLENDGMPISAWAVVTKESLAACVSCSKVAPAGVEPNCIVAVDKAVWLCPEDLKLARRTRRSCAVCDCIAYTPMLEDMFTEGLSGSFYPFGWDSSWQAVCAPCGNVLRGRVQRLKSLLELMGGPAPLFELLEMPAGKRVFILRNIGNIPSLYKDYQALVTTAGEATLT